MLFCPTREDDDLEHSGWEDTRGSYTAWAAGLVEVAELDALGVFDGIVTSLELNLFEMS